MPLQLFSASPASSLTDLTIPELLARQLSRPVVWVELALILAVAYAVWWLGRLLLRQLQQTLPAQTRVLLGLRWVWFFVCILGLISVGIFALEVPAPVLNDAGAEIASWFKNRAGRLVVVLALAQVAWHLISALSARIVPGDNFSRRSVRTRTLRGVVESSLRIVVVVAVVISVLQAVGINASTLLAGVSVFGLAVGFGAQSLIKDVFNGFFILLEDQYGVGDVISVNNGLLGGGVEKLNLRVTALRALDGTLHIIPNSQIQTVSVSTKDWSRVVAAVEITPEADLERALDVLSSVCDDLYADPVWNARMLGAPELQGVSNLSGRGVELRALMRVQPKTQWELQREFNRRIKLAFDAAGIELAYPHHSVNLPLPVPDPAKPTP
jgi:moderate conductance mechanosensitive channel